MEKRIMKNNGKVIAKPQKNNTFFLRNLRFFFLKKKGSKGQMFVIAGIIILIGFFMLRGIFGIYMTLEEKKYQETIIIDRELRNIQHEYEKIISVSRLQGNANDTAISNMMSFSTYLRGEEEMEILYVIVSLNNTAYTVTVGNFLNDNINLTVNASDSSPNSRNLSALNDMRNASASFSADVSTGVINVTLYYRRRSEAVTEIIPVRVAPLSKEGSFMQLFLDAKLKSRDDFVRVKSTHNTTW